MVLKELKETAAHFLPRVDIPNYNVLIDSRNFYDQPINDQIKKYAEIRKIEIGKGDNYTEKYNPKTDEFIKKEEIY